MKTEEINKNFNEAMTKVSEEDLNWLIINCLTFEEKIAFLNQMKTKSKKMIIEHLIYKL